jgi:hypothetical protein
MMSKYLKLFTLIGTASAGGAAHADQLRKIVSYATASTHCANPTQDQHLFQGSGVLLPTQGLVLTVAHILSGQSPRRCIFLIGASGEYTKLEVVAEDYVRDAAVLRPVDRSFNQDVINGLSTGSLQTAQVSIEGIPFGKRTPSILRGQIEHVERERLIKISNPSQTVPSEFGMSGGAVWDIDGKLLGIVTSQETVKAADGSMTFLTFAHSLRIYRDLLQDHIRGIKLARRTYISAESGLEVIDFASVQLSAHRCASRDVVGGGHGVGVGGGHGVGIGGERAALASTCLLTVELVGESKRGENVSGVNAKTDAMFKLSKRINVSEVTCDGATSKSVNARMVIYAMQSSTCSLRVESANHVQTIAVPLSRLDTQRSHILSNLEGLKRVLRDHWRTLDSEKMLKSFQSLSPNERMYLVKLISVDGDLRMDEAVRKVAANDAALRERILQNGCTDGVADAATNVVVEWMGRGQTPSMRSSLAWTDSALLQLSDIVDASALRYGLCSQDRFASAKVGLRLVRLSVSEDCLDEMPLIQLASTPADRQYWHTWVIADDKSIKDLLAQPACAKSNVSSSRAMPVSTSALSLFSHYQNAVNTVAESADLGSVVSLGDIVSRMMRMQAGILAIDANRQVKAVAP